MKKLFILLFAASLLSACSTTTSGGPYDALAQCMTSKGVKMYGSNTCPHCQEQKKAFKGSFDSINFIECNENPQECQKAEIKAYPTWEIDGKRTEGRKSLSELAELSGCPLSVDKAAEEQ